MVKQSRGGYQVLWHSIAHIELFSIPDVAERVAIGHAQEKLEAIGWRLGSPHSSAIKGEQGFGLRELRPRAGRSRWRPLYRRVGVESFVVLVLAPEASLNARGFDKAIQDAKRRFRGLENH